jgi:trypsin
LLICRPLVAGGAALPLLPAASAPTLSAGSAVPQGARRRAEEYRIVGGDEAPEGLYPHLVSLQTLLGFHFCAGVLLSATWVITAAHCMEGGQAFRVLAGAHSLRAAGLFGFDAQIRLPRRTIVHPQFGSGFSFSNDIALIELRSAVTSIDPVQRVATTGSPALKLATDAPLIAAGWGRTSENSPTTDVPHHVTVPLVSDEDCVAAFPGRVDPDLMLCAGVAAGGKDACQGDSGGPLLYQDAQGGQTLVGIVSWGVGCARPGAPGVYTQVSAFTPWICELSGVGCQALSPQADDFVGLPPGLPPSPPPSPPPAAPEMAPPEPPNLFGRLIKRLVRAVTVAFTAVFTAVGLGAILK